MANKTINAFELAIVLAKASRAPEELASNIDLTKLTRLINSHFTPEVAANAGTGSGPISLAINGTNTSK